MGKEISKRVSDAIEKTTLSDSQIASAVGVSTTTVWRWRKGKTTRFGERDLKSLANTVHVSYSWLQHGKGDPSSDSAIREIGRQVAEQGESYKGLDQTISGVESKARSLIQQLQDLIDDLEGLKKV